MTLVPVSSGGWRRPAITEFSSFKYKPTPGPTLSPGHPFLNVLLEYWLVSNTIRVSWSACLMNGNVGTGDKNYSKIVWYVRSSMSADRHENLSIRTPDDIVVG